MLSRTDAFKRAAEKDGATPTAIARITTSQLFAEAVTAGDWEAGTQQGSAQTVSLDGAHNASIATMTVDSTDGFSAPDGDTAALHPQAYIQINSEIIAYTGVTDTTFTGCTRGVYGTTAAAHADNDTVTQVEFDSDGGSTFDLGIQPKYWTDVTASGGPPSDRAGHSLVYNNQSQQLILFGGGDEEISETLNAEVWVYDIGSDTWTQKTPSGGPTARRDHGAAWDSTNTVMVIHGGHDGTNYLDDTWIYDPDDGAQGTWTSKSASGVTRARCACCFNTSDDRVYVVAGRNDSSSGYARNAYSFNVATDTWTQVSTETLSRRECAQGSFTISGNTIPYLGRYVNWAALLFDIGSGADSFGASPPFGATGMTDTCTVFDEISGRMIIVRKGNTADISHTYYYDVGADAWTRLPDFLEKRERAAACWDTDNAQMWMWGGFQDRGIPPTAPGESGPQRFRWFHDSMTWRSATLDLGSVPGNDGKVLIDSTLPQGGAPALTVTLEYSTDGNTWNDFNAGEPVYSGDILDQHMRYWRATAVLATNTGGSPLVQRIRINFDITQSVCLAARPVFGYPPIITDVPNQTSKIDPLKGTATIASLKLALLNNGDIVRNIFSAHDVFNTTVELLIGFDEPGFSEQDYLTYLTGVIQDWDDDGHTITISTRDPLDILKRKVPEAADGKLPSHADQKIVYNNSGTTHPIAIQKDIIQNQVNLNDIYIDVSSFDTVEAHSALSGWKFLRTLDEPAEAREYLEEINRLTGSIIIPGEDGRLRCDLYDAAESPPVEWDERHILLDSPRFSLTEKNLKNFIAVFFDGVGDKAEDYSGVAVQADAASITNWRRTAQENIFSKWIGPDDATYFGDARANDVATRLLTRFGESLPVVELDTNLDFLHVQVGDLVSITGGVQPGFESWTIPYVARGVSAVRGMKFQVVQKKVRLMEGRIGWTLWRAPEAIAEDFNSQEDWEDNEVESVSVSLTSTPGSVETADTSTAASYTLRVDLSQQPERDIAVTTTVTTPGSTVITIDVWGSHTGKWIGEEKFLGAGYISTGSDTIMDKYRFYRFVFHLIPDGSNTCRVDRFQMAGTR